MAIDVNSGRYVGKKGAGASLEDTITKINCEAAKEIVYQLRLRNIGGIIIIDFIDMDKGANREKVFKTLQEALAADRAKTNVLKISDIGLVEMTRKRVRESITRLTTEICPTCDGRGHVRSKITMAYDIMRVTDSRTRLRVISTRPSSEILRTFVFALSRPSASCRALKTFSRFCGFSMSMKSMMMMPPMFRSRSW